MILRNGYFYSTLALIYLVFITFPGYYPPIGTGLDFSWLWAINYVVNNSYLYGRDIVFTFGPLGFLLIPQNIGNNIAISMAFKMAVHLLFALTLCYILYRAKHKLQVILFAVCYAAVFSLFAEFIQQYNLLLVLGLLLYISYDETGILKYISASSSGVLAGILLFTKFNLGLAALAMLGVYAIISIILQRQKAWPTLTTALGAYAVTALIISMMYMESLNNALQWLRYSMEIAIGYGEAMSLVGSSVVVIIGSLVIVLYFFLTILLWRQKANSRYTAIIFLLPLLLAFKHSFCRNGIDNAPILFTIVLAMLCVLMLISAGKKELIMCVSVLLITILLSALSFNIPFFQGRVAIAGDIISGKVGWSNINSMIQYGELCKWLDEQGKANLARDRLPEEMVALIKSSGGRIDVVPWEICYCPANSLDWSPKFTLQSYSAYTAALDLRDSTHYEGNSAPDFLIAEFLAIDGRNILFDTPASWKSIIENYELIYTDDTGRLLLKKKAQQVALNLQTKGVMDSRIDTWIDLPGSQNLLFAELNLQPNLQGVISKALIGIPPLNMDLLYESGRVAAYRIIADTAKNGLLINYMPGNQKEMALLFHGTLHDRVVKFKITGIGTDYYSSDFIVKWQESDYFISGER